MIRYLWGVDMANQIKYFCSYEYYVNGVKQLSGCELLMIGVDIQDELYEAKAAVASQLNLKIDGLVFISFNRV